MESLEPMNEGSPFPEDKTEEDVAGKIFIGGLSWQTTEENLRAYFERYGELSDVALMMDKRTGKPRGFGFVKMKDPAAADLVMQNEHTIDGRLVDVKRALPRDKAPGPARSESCKIFVGGLSPDVSDADFGDYFRKFGAVKDAIVMMDRNTGSSRGFGFITFEQESSVDAVMKMNHELRGKPVEVKKAEPRDANPGRGFDNGMYGMGPGGYGGNRGGRGMGMMGMGMGMGMGGGRFGGMQGGRGMGDGYGAPGYGGGYMAGGMNNRGPGYGRNFPQSGGYPQANGFRGNSPYGMPGVPPSGYGYPTGAMPSAQGMGFNPYGGGIPSAPGAGPSGGYAGYGAAAGANPPLGGAAPGSGYGGAATSFGNAGQRPDSGFPSGNNDFSRPGQGADSASKGFDSSAIAAGYASAAMQMRTQGAAPFPYGGAAPMPGYGGGSYGYPSGQAAAQPTGLNRAPGGADSNAFGGDQSYGAYRGQGAAEARAGRSYRPY